MIEIIFLSRKKTGFTLFYKNKIHITLCDKFGQKYFYFEDKFFWSFGKVQTNIADSVKLFMVFYLCFLSILCRCLFKIWVYLFKSFQAQPENVSYNLQMFWCNKMRGIYEIRWEQYVWKQMRMSFFTYISFICFVEIFCRMQIVMKSWFYS